MLVRLAPNQEPLEFPVQFCHFCGGNLGEKTSEVDQKGVVCACIRAHAEDPSCPVKEDVELQEFNIRYQVGKRTGSLRMYFCPWCGTRLPEGLRHTLFNVPSEEDVRSLRGRLEGATTVEQVIRALGDPDRVWDPFHGGEVRSGPENKRILRQLDFNRLSPTARLIVHEYEDHTVTWYFSGHYIGKPRELGPGS